MVKGSKPNNAICSIKKNKKKFSILPSYGCPEWVRWLRDAITFPYLRVATFSDTDGGVVLTLLLFIIILIQPRCDTSGDGAGKPISMQPKVRFKKKKAVSCAGSGHMASYLKNKSLFVDI